MTAPALSDRRASVEPTSLDIGSDGRGDRMASNHGGDRECRDGTGSRVAVNREVARSGRGGRKPNPDDSAEPKKKQVKQERADYPGDVSAAVAAASKPGGAARRLSRTSAQASAAGTLASAATFTSLPIKADFRATTSGSPRKRRKVNHACVYCRRSHMTCDLERPCARCIKRDIGHLCHDEPREPSKKAKGEAANNQTTAEDITPSVVADSLNWKLEQQANRPLLQDQALPLSPSVTSVTAASSTALNQPISTSSPSNNPPNTTNRQAFGYLDWGFNPQVRVQDMHTFHQPYAFSTSEVTNEYNLLGDFLSSSLLDDSGMYTHGDGGPSLYSDPSLLNTLALTGEDFHMIARNQRPVVLPPPPPAAAQTQVDSHQSTAIPTDKARENYYRIAADPAGTDAPEERMTRLLKAKYDAGMLKPFNYVKGYGRLNTYMEQHMQASSRHKILRQLNLFRPKFRERMAALTDIQLIMAEMWFERSLMEYDRVFASMAIPACCWRRTGEIFRGNREMAELIHVPVDAFRDGKVAIHEIITEDQLVSYWEKFGAIAFDGTQKAMLTSCTLKNPDPDSDYPEIKCCFSFTIRRDPHNIPALIVGNFLPTNPKHE